MDQELKAYLEEREARMDERFKQLNDNVCLLGKAVIGMGDSINTLQAETTGRLEVIKGTVGVIQETLATRMKNLQNRVTVLEGKAERESRDVLEVLLERFGPRQA